MPVRTHPGHRDAGGGGGGIRSGRINGPQTCPCCLLT